MISIGCRIRSDITCILIPLVSFLALYFSPLPPFHRGFFCDDESIRYPYKNNTISYFAMILIGLTPVVVTFIICELYRAHRSKLPKRELIMELYRLISVFLFGGFLIWLLTEISKLMAGRLRPHFIDVCKPNLTSLIKLCHNSLGKSAYVEEDVCTGDAAAIKDARSSFPSGHAFVSSFSMVYLVLYLQARWSSSEFILLKTMLQFGVFLGAVACSLSRITDNQHHWDDVLAGFIFGTLIALIIVFCVADYFKCKELGKYKTLSTESNIS